MPRSRPAAPRISDPVQTDVIHVALAAARLHERQRFRIASGLHSAGPARHAQQVQLWRVGERGGRHDRQAPAHRPPAPGQRRSEGSGYRAGGKSPRKAP
ncbi:MAG: hypothetical protein WDN04_07830 [Rhodospirillales bacterium]